MYFRNFNFFILFLCLLENFRISDGLKCFECGSDYNQIGCEKFNKSGSKSEFETECPDTYNSCISTIGTYEDVSVYSRGCGKGKATGYCKTRTLAGGARATICSCSGDRCNEAYFASVGVKTAQQHKFITFIVIFAFFIQKYNNM